MRILFVEDDPAVADLLDRTIRQAAWAADITSRGSLALEALAVHPTIWCFWTGPAGHGLW